MSMNKARHSRESCGIASHPGHRTGAPRTERKSTTNFLQQAVHKAFEATDKKTSWWRRIFNK